MHCEVATSSPDGVIVLVETPAGPRHLGYALDPAEAGTVTELAFAEGTLYVGALTSSPDAPSCCPDVEFKYFYDLDRQGDLRLVQSYRRAWVDPGSPVDDSDEGLARDQACAQIEVLTAEVRSLQQKRVQLSGGSAEGIPTYNQSVFFANLDDIQAVNMRALAVQRSLTLSRRSC